MEYNGCIHLTVKKSERDKKNYPARQYYRLPLQVMPPFYQDTDGTAFFYLLNPSGGIMEYDHFLIDICLEAQASACITTPSATKIYRQRTHQTATQEAIFHLGEDSTLEYLPEETMPYADSAFHQRNRFFLKKSSRLIACDILSAGRISRQENFLFQDYHSTTEIYIDEHLILLDKTNIIPKAVSVRNPLCMENYDYTASVYAYAPECTQSVVQRIRNLESQYTDGLMGVSLIRNNLLVIKLTGSHAYLINDEIHKIWSILRSEILQKEAVFIRK